MGPRCLNDIIEGASTFMRAVSGAELLSVPWPESAVGEMYTALRATGLLPQPAAKLGKSDVRAERFRRLGNETFVRREGEEKALQLYSQAVCAARPDGTEIALSYANRSAVTFALSEYRQSMADIDRALTAHYPAHLRYKLYERRGKCLLSLKQYREAAKAFELVKTHLLKSSLPEQRISEVTQQVDQLIDNCEEKSDMELEVEKTWDVRLSSEPSVEIESASAAVEIRDSAEMGRCVVAAVDILPGEVLAIEKPYASTLKAGSNFLFCEWCKRRCHSSVPCSSCDQALYCDEGCRRAAWTSHHSIECDLTHSLTELSWNHIELLSLRVLIVTTDSGARLSQLFESYSQKESSEERRGFVNGRYLSGHYRPIHELETNCVLRDGKDLFPRIVCSAFLVHLLNETTDFFCREAGGPKDLYWRHAAAGELIFRHLMTVPSNAHDVGEMRLFAEDSYDNVQVGAALYAFHSLINHSCDPNVVRHSHNGHEVVLSAIQPIKQGDQLFDNYGFHYAVQDLASRQEHLSSQYYFTCRCIACVEDWPLYADLPNTSPSTQLSPSSSLHVEAISKLVKNLKSGTANDEDFKVLCTILSAICTVKRPWRPFNDCQEAMKHFLCFKGNHYVHKTCN